MPNTLSVLHAKKGDMPVAWDENNPDEIEQAQATFDSLTAKGYSAYSMSKDGKKGLQIKKFDKSLGRIQMVPPLVGG
jgi:hypothetical protein